MKFLKYFLILITVLIIAFLVKAYTSSPISYTSEIKVQKPLKEAWSVMGDPTKLSLWLKGITHMEHVSGEKGKVGAVTKYTFTENGKDAYLYETIKSINAFKSMSMDFEMKEVMLMEYHVDFYESESSTIIKSATTVKGLGLVMKSMLSFMKDTMKKQEDENMNNLKKVIEENITDYSSVI